jgi:hypothetical protein
LNEIKELLRELVPKSYEGHINGDGLHVEEQKSVNNDDNIMDLNRNL